MAKSRSITPNSDAPNPEGEQEGPQIVSHWQYDNMIGYKMLWDGNNFCQKNISSFGEKILKSET